MSYLEIYFAVASVATILVAGILVLVFIYILSILIDIKRISKTAKEEVKIIARGLENSANLFGSHLSEETVGFVKTIFAILLSHFADKKSSSFKTKRSKKATKGEEV